jgi:hypothetical protein
LLAVRSIRRPPSLGTTSFLLTAGVNELPFVFLALVVVSTAPILSAGAVTPMGWLAVALAVLTLCGLGVVVAAALRTGRRPVRPAQWAPCTQTGMCIGMMFESQM